MIHCLLLLTTEENETTQVKRVSRTLIFSICKYYSSRRVRVYRNILPQLYFPCFIIVRDRVEIFSDGVRRAIVPNEIARVSANRKTAVTTIDRDRAFPRNLEKIT